MADILERSPGSAGYLRRFQNACLLLAYLAVVVTSVWSDAGYSEVWWKRSAASLWIDVGHSQGVTMLETLMAFALVCSVVWAELSSQRVDTCGAISTTRSSNAAGVLRPPDSTWRNATYRNPAADRERVAHRRAS